MSYYHDASVYRIGDVSGDLKGRRTGKTSPSPSSKLGVVCKRKRHFAYFANEKHF